MSLKVVGTATVRSATYDFLLVIPGIHGPISYRFRNGDFGRNSQLFLIPFS